MAFNAADIYVEGGNNKISHMWTPGVEKFDTSSFYNWEQDNIPLYDLEERTYYLWEKAGWPTSGSPQVSGVVFSVSADALGTQAYADNPNIFLSLSSAIEALPDVIRYPIRVEVGSFGELGELVLNNIHFTDNGALEFVNRNFSPINPGHDLVVSSYATATNTGNGAGYNTATTNLRYISTVSSLDTSNTLNDTSCLGIAPVASAVGDPRWDNNSIVVAQMVHEMRKSTNYFKAARLSVGLYPSNPMGTAANKFSFTNYGDLNDKSISGYDFSSTYNEVTDAKVFRLDYAADSPTEEVGVVGAYYGNWLSKIDVNNCGGQIYIRNFAVDGAKGATTPTSHSTKHGIDIHNSKVVLEYCTALRCYESGFNLVNSDVILSRGAYAYRNYGLSSNTDSDHARASSVDSAGFRLVNSDVTLSSVGQYGASGGACQFTSTRSEHGVFMHNSTMKGGDKRLTGTNSMSMTSLMSFGNTKTGVKMFGSCLDLNGGIDVFLNKGGIDATNSDIKIDELYVDNTQGVGVHLKNSQLVYAKNAPDIVEKTLDNSHQYGNQNLMVNTGVTVNGLFPYAEDPGMVTLDFNAQHLKLENSKYYHPRLSAAAGLSRTKYKRGMGVTIPQSGKKFSIPSIVCDNNSLAYLTFARIQTQTGSGFGWGGNNSQMPITSKGRGGTGNASYGSCILIKDNSTCRLVGGQNKFTLVDGPADYEDQINNAGVFVDNHSTLKVHGPTLMSRFGVDVLADHNSTLDISPPKDDYGFVDSEQWALTTAQNQTKVDLHSSRACLVADNNSVINMTDCGDFNAQWASGAADVAVHGSVGNWFASSLVLSANYSTYETSAYTKDGSIQFYPNPQLQYGQAEVPYDADGGSNGFARSDTDTQTFPLADAANELSSFSRGGVCLRSLRGSRVNVRNVNFPAGWNNTSALYYNYSTTSVDPQGCEQLRIWNVDATSRVDMSYLSVSGHFPPLVGYNGPSSVYVVAGGSTGAELAPPTTPYTSSLSVLDSFGPSGTPGNTHSDPQNFGPFRLYFSPKLYSKYLVYENEPNEETSVIYQTIAQGYNMSGPCSAVSVPTHALTTSSGPDLYSVYGAGPTSPSGVQADISISSMTASSEFALSPMSKSRDWRWYTSAVAYSVAPQGNVSCGRTKFGDATEDGFPGRATDCGYGYIKPVLKHYTESNFIYAKDLLPVDYASRVILDESAIASFANAKNATLGLSGKPRLVTMISSTTSYAGEGAQAEKDLAGRGFLSASEFDLNKID